MLHFLYHTVCQFNEFSDRPHVFTCLPLQDEPTNNLDIESIDALSEAINEYKGGMWNIISILFGVHNILQIAYNTICVECKSSFKP